MSKRKRPRDPNQLAKMIMELTTRTTTEADPDAGKDAAAVTRGRQGGRKGGKVRAQRMSADERQKSAQRAAKARWAKRGNQH